jgi:uncharacterized surface protein with fasciclin (FAS1) repeats
MKHITAALLTCLIVGCSFIFAQTNTSNDSVPTVNIGAEGILSGTITAYLESNVADAATITDQCYDHDMANNQFTCLSLALTNSGLDQTLDGAGPFTLFAPTDEAFKTYASGMTAEEFNSFLSDKELLTNVLSFHVLPEKRTLSDLNVATTASEISVATVETSNLTLNFSGEGDTDSVVTFVDHNDAYVVEGQVVTDNGVIIPINNVLTPSSN